jgi:hypothetical protein
MRQKIQILLGLAIFITACRVAYIFYSRHESQVATAAQPSSPALNPDYYVTPRKLYPYDLKSARALSQQPVWVKVGYSIAYFPYDRSSRRVDFSHQAGLLLPIERLEIKDVVVVASNRAKEPRQLMALFVKQDKTCAFSIGSVENDEYHIASDEMLFIEDPHKLYGHWPAPIWDAIDKHQVKVGMNELQADFAVGMGVPQSGDETDKTVEYPDGGTPLLVSYHAGKAIEVKPGAPAS